jgi:hypothetical protein
VVCVDVRPLPTIAGAVSRDCALIEQKGLAVTVADGIFTPKNADAQRSSGKYPRGIASAFCH